MMVALDRRSMLAGVAALWAAPLASLAQPRPALPPMDEVDPELRAILAGRPLGDTPLATMMSPQRRAAVGRVLPAPAPQPVERRIPGPPGAPEVRVLVVDPGRAAAPRPALLYLHGGGYVMGRADGSVALLQELARDDGVFGVSVDYRLAPETPFPGSLEDNYAALKWLHAHAAELGVDPNRIAIGGASAGGGHAAGLAIAARDRREVPVAFQLLIYPMLDDRTASTRPARPNAGRFIWTPANNRIGWQALLGRPPGGRDVPPLAAPARVADLRGLPPAFIGVGDIDLFADEDVAYAQRLMAAGVPTELMVVPGAFHAFDGVAPESGVSRAFTAEWKRALRKALGIGR